MLPSLSSVAETAARRAAVPAGRTGAQDGEANAWRFSSHSALYDAQGEANQAETIPNRRRLGGVGLRGHDADLTRSFGSTARAHAAQARDESCGSSARHLLMIAIKSGGKVRRRLVCRRGDAAALVMEIFGGEVHRRT